MCIRDRPTNKKGKPYHYFIYNSCIVSVDDVEHVEEVQKKLTDMGFQEMCIRDRVKVIISYEDENGEVSEVEKELTLYVSEPAPDMDDMDTVSYTHLDVYKRQIWERTESIRGM